MFRTLRRIASALEQANLLRQRADVLSEQNEQIVRQQLESLKTEQRMWMMRIEAELRKHIDACNGDDDADDALAVKH